jgi:hypothetical protein
MTLLAITVLGWGFAIHKDGKWHNLAISIHWSLFDCWQERVFRPFWRTR